MMLVLMLLKLMDSGYNLVAGANIAGFLKVADAMMAQGLV